MTKYEQAAYELRHPCLGGLARDTTSKSFNASGTRALAAWLLQNGLADRFLTEGVAESARPADATGLGRACGAREPKPIAEGEPDLVALAIDLAESFSIAQLIAEVGYGVRVVLQAKQFVIFHPMRNRTGTPRDAVLHIWKPAQPKTVN